MIQANGKTAKQILMTWAKAKGITPRQFSRDIHCSDTHAWYTLRDPKYPLGLPTLAKLLIVYGADGPALEMAKVTTLN
jgi:hypothetical protein